MVKGLYGHAQNYSVVFQPCYLKTMDEIKAVLPKRPPIFRATPKFRSAEQTTCWGIAARVRRKYLGPPYDYCEDDDLRDLTFKLPIRVYMFGPPTEPGGRFSEWFAKANDLRYRIVVSTTPDCYGKHEFLPHIGPHGSDRPKLITVGADHLNAEERRIGKAFITEFAEAAWFGQVALDDLLLKIGHFYWYSDGMPLSSGE